MSRIHDALKRAELRQPTPDTETIASPEPRAAGASVFSLDETRTDSSLGEMEQALVACPPKAWKPNLNTMLFFVPQEGRPGMEQFRTLRSRLGLARNDRPELKKVLISSALPQEGKSTVAANLAQVIVYQDGPRVLLIDADLRTPCLHQELGAPVAPGLAEYMQGDCGELEIIQRGPLQNLYFVPAGAALSNPAEQIANGRMKALLDRVEPLFDWIIIDSSPAAVVSDASVLATHCDGVLLVVRSGVTPIERAKQACGEFHESKLLGVVLNAANDAKGPYGQEYAEQNKVL